MSIQFRHIFLGFLVLFSTLPGSVVARELQSPIAQQVPYETTVNGDTRSDPYFWLRDRKNPDVLSYVQAENAYTTAASASFKKIQDAIYQESMARFKDDDTTVPVWYDGYYYYEKTETDRPHPIHVRRKGSMTASEEILLDENELAEQYEFMELGVFQVSPNHRYLAYSIDTNGSETFTLFIKDLQTGKLWPEKIPNTYYSVEWANDNQAIFYNVLDEAKRPYQLFRHTLGTSPQKDSLIYHEQDASFELTLGKTRDHKYLLLTLESLTTSEIHYLDAARPQATWQVFQARKQGVLYSLAHHKGIFFVLTNEDAPNFKLLKTPVIKGDAKLLVPGNPHIMLENIDLFKNELIIYERENAIPYMRVWHLASGENYRVEFPESVYDFSPQDNPEFDTNHILLHYTSLVTPPTVYDYDLKQRKLKIRKQEPVVGYQPQQYQTERIYAPASDGAQIPITLVYKRGIKKDGKNPLLLYAYGAYGANGDVDFSSPRLSILDRGFIYAVAHIRGGADMGRNWYAQGHLLHKKNSFQDFIASAEYLIAQEYTTSEKLAINGISAGGLLMGAVTNMRPDLFHTVVAEVPFVDALNTMLDPTLPLTVIEYEEWGNPQEKIFYDYIRSYSPYDNVGIRSYPHMLVTAGWNDPRVSYWEPAKWVAKLRQHWKSERLLLLYTNMNAGHAGASDRETYLREQALLYGFMVYTLGLP